MENAKIEFAQHEARIRKSNYGVYPNQNPDFFVRQTKKHIEQYKRECRKYWLEGGIMGLGDLDDLDSMKEDVNLMNRLETKLVDGEL